jgi:hypothetical protein
VPRLFVATDGNQRRRSQQCQRNFARSTHKVLALNSDPVRRTALRQGIFRPLHTLRQSGLRGFPALRHKHRNVVKLLPVHVRRQ